ncbi:MAG TPA: nuclear transport factor 2 family protein [Pyrinomonadaceae bacterium]|nr:nuclear transport factor 2 family protein [Pyrinomonadaceae bacterium]
MPHQDDSRRVSDHQVAQLIRQMNEEWVRAFVGGDAAVLDRIMADDFAFAYPLEGDDKMQFISEVASGAMKVEYLHRDHVNVCVYGSTAVLTCRDNARWHYHGREIAGYYKTLHVYAARDGQWQLVAVQSCPYK